MDLRSSTNPGDLVVVTWEPHSRSREGTRRFVGIYVGDKEDLEFDNAWEKCVRIRFESNMVYDYDGERAELVVYGDRLETDEEEQKRIEKAQAAKAAAKKAKAKAKANKEERDRKEYERLKKKFEG